jgi:hypothetical protein
MTLTRISKVAVFTTLCALLSFSTSALADLVLAEGGPTGQWTNFDRSGEGFYVEIIRNNDGNRIGIAYFGYDQNGDPIWASHDVEIDSDATVVEMDLFDFAGPEWGPGFDEDDRLDTVFGYLTARWPNCDNAYITISPTDPALVPWNFPMVRLTSIQGLSCTNPPPPAPTGITPGKWSGPGVCFNVSAGGDSITEVGSACDQSNAFDSKIDGLNNELEKCDVEADCEGVWLIKDGNFVCLSELGTMALGSFSSENSASGQVFEGSPGRGDVCTASWTATPD